MQARRLPARARAYFDVPSIVHKLLRWLQTRLRAAASDEGPGLHPAGAFFVARRRILRVCRCEASEHARHVDPLTGTSCHKLHGMTQILQRTVLFADLRGSTALYESLGNTEATTVVTRSVALVGRIVTNHRGMVVKTLGDGLMAVFASRRRPRWTRPTRCTIRWTASRRPPPARSRRGPHPGAEPAGRHGTRRGRRDVGRRVRRRRQRRGPPAGPRRRQRDPRDRQRRPRQPAPVRERFRSLDRVQLRGRVEPVHVLPARRPPLGDTAATRTASCCRVRPIPKASASCGST